MQDVFIWCDALPPSSGSMPPAAFSGRAKLFIREIKDDNLWSICSVAFNENPEAVTSRNGIQVSKCSGQAESASSILVNLLYFIAAVTYSASHLLHYRFVTFLFFTADWNQIKMIQRKTWSIILQKIILFLPLTRVIRQADLILMCLWDLKILASNAEVQLQQLYCTNS